MNLTINNLSKTYSNGVRALDNVSLTIPNGLFGLLGPNGAGKSTLMRTLATLQEADEGEIWFDNIDVLRQKHELKKVLGYLPQEFGFYPRDRAINLLDQLCMLKGVKNKPERKQIVEYILKKVNLWEARKQRIGTYSGGMKQRFGIAQALLGNPKLIIVDEPTAGLDPNQIVEIRELIRRIGENREEIVMVDLAKIANGSQPDFFIKPNDMINIGTHGTSRWMAVLRNAFRATYGFGFIYDRNFADRDFGTSRPIPNWF